MQAHLLKQFIDPLNTMQSEDLLLFFVICLIPIGFSYGNNFFQAIETPLRQAPLYFTSLQFNLLFLFVNVSSILSSIPIGILIDKYPIDKSNIIVAAVSLVLHSLNALVFHLAPFSNQFACMYVVQFALGMMKTTVATLQGVLLVKFAGVHFQLLTGLCVCASYIVEALSIVLTPLIYEVTQSISAPFLIPIAIDQLPLAGSIILASIIRNKNQRMDIQELQFQQIKEDTFKMQDLKSMPRLFWLVIVLIIINMFVGGGIFSNMSDLLGKRFGISYLEVGKLQLIPFITVIIFSVVFGKILAHCAKFRRGIIFGLTLIYAIGLLVLWMLPNTFDPHAQKYTFAGIIFFLFSIGLYWKAYSIISPIISLIVDQNKIGTAMGVGATALSLGKLLGPCLNSIILNTRTDLSAAYTDLTFGYVCASLPAVISAAFLYFGDYSDIDRKFSQKVIQVREDD